MAEYNAFYRRAYYYDVVFKRDVSPEIRFIQQIYRQFNNQQSPASLLDLACGPGYHARTFAAMGGRAVGLDLRPEMIAFAQAEAELEGAQVEWVAQDMRYFRLDAPVDVTLNAFDGIDCLTENSDLVAHLCAVGENLTSGGLYFIDVTNPAQLNFGHYGTYRYSGERDGVQVDIQWAVNHPCVDVTSHIAHTELTMFVMDDGQSQVIQDSAVERVLTAQEIALLAQLSGMFKPVAWFGAYDLQRPLTNDPIASPRMIAVLQKVT